MPPLRIPREVRAAGRQVPGLAWRYPGRGGRGEHFVLVLDQSGHGYNSSPTAGRMSPFPMGRTQQSFTHKALQAFPPPSRAFRRAGRGRTRATGFWWPGVAPWESPRHHQHLPSLHPWSLTTAAKHSDAVSWSGFLLPFKGESTCRVQSSLRLPCCIRVSQSCCSNTQIQSFQISPGQKRFIRCQMPRK